MTPGRFEVSTHQRPNGTEVRCVGELDAAAVFRLEPIRKQVPVRSETQRIVVDLHELTFIDSAGLAALVAAHERFKDLGIESCFIRPSDSVMRVFELTGLDAAFDFGSRHG